MIENDLDASYLMEVSTYTDQRFIKELHRLHDAFVDHVVSIISRAGRSKDEFKSIATGIAEARNYIFLCDKLFIPVCFQERLMRILKDQELKNNPLPNDQESQTSIPQNGA